MRRSHALIYVALYLLAWAARLALMGDHRLHPDEALYGQWGLLIFSGRDPWLVSVPAYKPPLLPYVLSGMLALLGCHPYRPLPIGAAEWAVRLPGLVSGMVTVGLTGRLARQLYRSEAAGRAAALAVALSPFAILFSATGFLDPPMVALGLGGCVAALAGRPGWAGLLVGLSCAAKQTGLVWLPLTFFFVFARHHRNPKRPSASCLLHHLSFVIFHSIIVVGLVGVWDAVRVAQGTQSFWQTGVAGYGGLRLIWPVEVAPRLRAWAAWLPHLLGWPLLGVAVVGAVGLVIRGVRRRDWPALFDVALVGFCLLYVLVHWLWAFPVWDRYLLPLVPVMGVLTGRVVSWLLPTAALDRRHDLALAADERSRGYDRCAHNRWAKMAPVVAGLLTHRSARSGDRAEQEGRKWRRGPSRHSRVSGNPLVAGLDARFSRFRGNDSGHDGRMSGYFRNRFNARGQAEAGALAVLLLCLAVPAVRAVTGALPVGAAQSTYDGIEQVVAMMRTVPEGSVLYHHWLGWEYDFYLFDAPLYRAYWPTPAWLAEDVRVFGQAEPRYIVFPAWESSARVEAALADVGYRLEPVLAARNEARDVRFRVYRIANCELGGRN